MSNIIPTITIGIPAHNEERNLPYMLRSIARQRQERFRIEKIYVMCDGCTDRTAEVARGFTSDLPQLEVIDDGRRLGKVGRTNEAFSMCRSDYYFSIDADLVLTTEDALENMVAEFARDERVELVAGHLEPTKPSNWVEWVNIASHRLWDETRLPLNGGNHPHNLMGGFYAVNRRFYEHFRFPAGLSSDAGYLYFSATKDGLNGFRLCKDARVYFHYPDNLFECRLLATRAIYTKRWALYEYFGEEFVEHAYRIPMSHKIRVIFKMILRHPFGTLASILMNLYIRAFPIQDALTSQGMW